MKLAEKLLENERTKQVEQSKKLVLTRLKDLVYAFPEQVEEVLYKTGIPVSGNLPQSVKYAIVIKHLDSNSLLRESIAKMLLEMDGYSSADGQGWQLVGGAMSALGSVLGGIGRSQTKQAETDNSAQLDQMQQQLDNNQAKHNRQMWLFVGGAIVAIVIVILVMRAMYKKSASVATSLPVSQGGAVQLKSPTPLKAI